MMYGLESPKPEEILALGRRLAAYTSAPLTSLNKPAGAPFPTEEIMRRGRLGLGEQMPEPVGEIRELNGGQSVSACLPLLELRRKLSMNRQETRATNGSTAHATDYSSQTVRYFWSCERRRRSICVYFRLGVSHILPMFERVD